MKRFGYLHILSILLSLSLFSCVDDELMEVGETFGLVTLHAELSVPSVSEVMTRAKGVKSEETIDNITVLVFDNTKTDAILVESVSGITPKDDHSFSVPLTTRSGATLIYVLANAEDFILPPVDTQPTLSEIRQLLTDSISIDKIENGYVASSLPFPLPMAGKLLLPDGITSRTVINKTGIKDDDAMLMVRSVAKFSVALEEEVSNFKLTGAALCRVSPAGRIISNQPDIDDVFSDPDTSPELLAKESINYYDKAKEELIFTPASSNLIDNMYSYETKAKDGESVKLVIRGTYTVNRESKDVYYLLGIINGDKKNYDIVRNHHYKVKINKIAAEGAPTFSKALNGPIANDVEMDFTVEDDSYYNTTVYKDEYLFSLDYDDVTIYCDSLDNFTLSFLSTDFDGAENKVNSLSATSNRVNGQPTLYFANNATETTLPVVVGAQKGMPNTYPINVNLKPGFTEGSVTLRLSSFEKNITLHKKRFRDLHYDSLHIANAISVKVLSSSSSSSWITLSSYNIYTPTTQRSSLQYSSPATAYIYIDETLEQEARYADLEYVQLLGTTVSKRKLVVGQAGIKRYNIGFWSGIKVNNEHNIANFSGQLLVEAYEEDEEPVLWIESPSDLGDLGDMIKNNESHPKEATRFLYQTGKSPAATRCMNKNRDLNGDGEILEDEIKWYLPSAEQGLGISLYQVQVEELQESYWSSTLHNISGDNTSVFALNTYKVRDNTYPSLGNYYGAQLTNVYVVYKNWGDDKHWEKRYVRCVRDI